jgi:hypothetical protein
MLRSDRTPSTAAQGGDQKADRIHRMRLADRRFFVGVNLRRRVELFRVSDYPLLIEVVG